MMGSVKFRSWRQTSKTMENHNNNNHLTYKDKNVNQRRVWCTQWIWCNVVVGTCSILCYINNIHGDFVHDDINAITTNPDVRGERSIWHLFVNDFWGKPMADPNSHKSYRPVCVLTFRLNYMFGELNPVGYHVTNNLLHCLATLLFTNICREIIFCGDIICTSLAGLMFAAHPIHTEAVSGLVGRADVLSCIFFLLSFKTYHKYSASTKGSPDNIFWPVRYAALAMLSKEQGITVFGLCILYELYNQWCHTKRRNSGLNTVYSQGCCIRHILKLSISMIMLITFRLWLLGGTLPKFQKEDNPASFSPDRLTRVLTYTYLWTFNGWLMLFPVNLSHDWQMGSIPLVESLWDNRNIASLCLMVLMISLICKALESRRIFFGLALAVLPFLLASNIFVTVGFVAAERVLYMSSMGIIVLIVNGVDHVINIIPDGWRHLKLFSVTVLILLPACRTVSRNSVWNNRHSLARSGLEVLPHNAKMHYNYGNLLADMEDTHGALHHYQTAIRLWPGYASAHNNLAYHTENKTDALSHLREVIRLSPCHGNAYTNMANIYYKSLNRTEEAIELLQIAMECESTDPIPHVSLAAIYQDLDRTFEADRHYKTALSLAPTQPHVHHNVALFLESRGEHQTAIKHLETAISLDPYSHISVRTLAKIYRTLGLNDKAQDYWNRALRLNRDQTTLDMAGTFLYNIGNFVESLQLFQEAYANGPLNVEVIIHISQALTSLEDYEHAENILQRHIPDYPNDANLILQLANVLGMKKQHRQAVVLLDTFIRQHGDELTISDASRIYLQNANHQKDLHQLDIAIKNYHRAIRLDEDNAEAHHNLAVYYHKKRQYDKAMSHYQIASKLMPEDELLHQNYNSLLSRLKPRSSETNDNKYTESMSRGRPNDTTSHHSEDLLMTTQGFNNSVKLGVRFDRSLLSSTSNSP